MTTAISSTVFIPKKIKVGYCERKDTYTGRIAYVIYYDAKGKLRKETGWRAWQQDAEGGSRRTGKEIPPDDFDNDPISGFVLNKNIGGEGGGGWGWEAARRAKCRVYDPRGFEFEITIENLLYILENASSIKGKGLEGNFVYGWDGKDHLLIPEGAPEYQQHMEYSDMLTTGSVKSKDLVLGAIYRSNKNVDYVYLGRFDYYDQKFTYDGDCYHDANKGLHYFFELLKKPDNAYTNPYIYIKSLSGRIIKTVDPNPVLDYAERMDRLEHQTSYSPYVPASDVMEPATIATVKESFEWRSHSKLYTEIDGIEFKVSLREGYNNGNYNEKNGLYKVDHLERVHKLEHSKDRYYGWRDHVKDGIESRLKSEGWLWDSYSYHHNKNEKEHSIQTLIDHFQLKIKRRFLKNGKEKRHYNY